MNSFSNPSRHSIFIFILPYLIALILFGMTIEAYRYVYERIDGEHRAAFYAQTQTVIESIEDRINQYEIILGGARGLFSASKSVERDEFKAYVSSLDFQKHFPGAQGIAFMQYVLDVDKNALEDLVRADGFKDFSIRPSGKRESYAPIIYIEPFEGKNLKAFGFDLYSEPIRHAAMASAWQNNAYILSDKVTLIQEEAEPLPQPGLVLVLPVYKNHQSIGTLEERQKSIFGFLTMPLRMYDFIGAVLKDKLNGIHVQIYDSDKADLDSKLFDTDLHVEQSPQMGLYKRTVQEHILNQTWTFVFISSLSDQIGFLPGLVFLGGSLISILVLLIFINMGKINLRVQKIAETKTKELEQNNARLKGINDSSPLGIYVTDPNGDCIYVNDAYKKIIEADFDQIKEKGWVKFIHPGDRDYVNQRWYESVEQRRPFIESYRFLSSQGKVIWANVMAVELVIEGKAAGYVGTVQDITQMRLKENLLKESEQRSRAIVDYALDPIVVLNEEGRVVSWNKPAEVTFGYILSEIQNHSFLDTIIDEKMRGQFKQILDETSKSNTNLRLEIIAQTKSKNVVYCEASITAFNVGEKSMFSLFLRDISASKTLKELEEKRVATIERMNKLMVDREMKMVALKKEIAGLKGEGGSPS